MIYYTWPCISGVTRNITYCLIVSLKISSLCSISVQLAVASPSVSNYDATIYNAASLFMAQQANGGLAADKKKAKKGIFN